MKRHNANPYEPELHALAFDRQMIIDIYVLDNGNNRYSFFKRILPGDAINKRDPVIRLLKLGEGQNVHYDVLWSGLEDQALNEQFYKGNNNNNNNNNTTI